MITLDKSGGRSIQLFIPFEFNNKKIEAITLAPLRLGHVIRWNEGAWKTSIELLVELAGVDQAIIRELRYPDADRVMDSFMALLTPEIRADIAEGRIPIKDEFGGPEKEPTRVTNGSGDEIDPMLHAPGVPLPEAGFDLGEEAP